mmetsp:Transcript_59576/g.153429  ORF Transcript_59576/g.153429 Transcript_59576/m.153429 type:complete len:206 (+) Transcript_59576:952-1569(+)
MEPVVVRTSLEIACFSFLKKVSHHIWVDGEPVVVMPDEVHGGDVVSRLVQLEWIHTPGIQEVKREASFGHAHFLNLLHAPHLLYGFATLVPCIASGLGFHAGISADALKFVDDIDVIFIETLRIPTCVAMALALAEVAKYGQLLHHLLQQVRLIGETTTTSSSIQTLIVVVFVDAVWLHSGCHVGDGREDSRRHFTDLRQHVLQR